MDFTTRIKTDFQHRIDEPEYLRPYPTKGRNCAIILAFLNYPDGQRNGALTDVQSLVLILPHYGYVIELVEIDPRSDRINNILNKLKEQDFRDYDSVLLIVSAHGNENGIAVKGSYMSFLYSSFQDPLTNNQSLKDKPKWVIFSSCNGSTKLGAVMHVQQRADADAGAVGETDYSDMLVTHAAAKGFSAFRVDRVGTFLLRGLCMCLDNHRGTDGYDISNLLLDLNYGISQMVLSVSCITDNQQAVSVDYRQISESVVRLRRPFFLYRRAQPLEQTGKLFVDGQPYQNFPLGENRSLLQDIKKYMTDSGVQISAENTSNPYTAGNVLQGQGQMDDEAKLYNERN